MMKENLLEIYAASFRDNWTLPALTDYGSGRTRTYSDFAETIARTHLLFEQLGIKRGDKVALIGKNSSRWVAVFMSVITYGAVIVPVLHEFNPQDAQHIVIHSDARLLFVSDDIWETFDADRMPELLAVMSLDNGRPLAMQVAMRTRIEKAVNGCARLFKKRYPDGFRREDVRYPSVGKDDVAVINYTSGTTGYSKGVMLTYNNLCGNVVFGIKSQLHYRGSRCLSFLPLAHAYGCAFDMLVPLAVGTHVTLLGRLPSPRILVKAMGEVRPNLVICVPLILEKVYRKQILPMISKRSVRWSLSVPLLDKAIYARIRNKLVEAFGGEFEEVIVGGAPLNGEVEEFLHRIKFPFTVGYGMTECGPLISYTPWRQFICTSSGRTLPGIMKSRIDSPDGNALGEICVKGENVMKGYYKNKEATNDVLDRDGWLHTGDMGTISSDGTIFIKGRYKTMILGASGQNIYPEEIEAKLNNMPYVAESLVVDRDGRLVALVYPDFEAMDADGLVMRDMPERMERVRRELNSIVAPYERIESIHLRGSEFEKTPKRSIKRYLYQN